MTPEQQRQCFELRMKLSAAGFDWRAVYPSGEVVRFVTVSESGIRQLGSDYGEATLTGIVDQDGHLKLVTKCPPTAAELAAIEAERVAAEEAAKVALVEAALAHERERKAAKRRADGKPTRAEWLAKHSQKPWIDAEYEQIHLLSGQTEGREWWDWGWIAPRVQTLGVATHRRATRWGSRSPHFLFSHNPPKTEKE